MEELYEQNAKIVFHFLCSLCHDEQLAEELTQETFLQAYKSLERYDGSCKVSTWLCQIAKHLYYQYIMLCLDSGRKEDGLSGNLLWEA